MTGNRIVAECWTCKERNIPKPAFAAPAMKACRAAGHDVRPVAQAETYLGMGAMCLVCGKPFYGPHGHKAQDSAR